MWSLLDRIEARLAAVRGKGNSWYSIASEVNAAVRLMKDQGGLIIDIGGNVGEYAALLRARLPGAEIHIFEPAPINIQALRNRFDSDTRVILQPYALSDSASTAILYSDTPGSGLASLTQRRLEHHGLRLDLAQQVETIRFEDYWRNNLSGRRITFAKVDVEGHELTALRGFGEAINHTDLVQFEFGGTCIDTRVFFRDFWYFFQEHGFQIHRITPIGLEHIRKYREADECFNTTNFIACRI